MQSTKGFVYCSMYATEEGLDWSVVRNDLKSRTKKEPSSHEEAVRLAVNARGANKKEVRFRTSSFVPYS